MARKTPTRVGRTPWKSQTSTHFDSTLILCSQLHDHQALDALLSSLLSNLDHRIHILVLASYLKAITEDGRAVAAPGGKSFVGG